MYLKLLLQEVLFSSKMHQIPFGGRSPPGPARELTALPRSHSWIKGSFLLRERIWEGKGGKGTRRRPLLLWILDTPLMASVKTQTV